MAYAIKSQFGKSVANDLAPWLTDHLAWLLDAIGGEFDPTYSIVAEQGNDGDANYVPGFGSLFDVDLCPTGALPYLAQFVGTTIPAGAPDQVARGLVRAPAGWQRGTPGAFLNVAQAYLTGTGFTGTLTAGSATVTAVSSFTNLHSTTYTLASMGGATCSVTGAGVPAGTTVTALNSGASTLTLSQAATVSGVAVPLVSRTVWLEERFGGDAYQLRVATYSSETKDSGIATYALAKAKFSSYAGAKASIATYSAARGTGQAALTAALVAVKPGGVILNYDAITGTDYRSASDAFHTYSAAKAAFATYSAAHTNPTGS